MNDGPPEPEEEGPAATSEVVELRSEVADLRRQLDRQEVWGTRRRRARRWFVGVLVALFSVGVVASLIGVWAERTALDTDSFVNTVDPVPRDPDVSRALSAFIAEEQGVFRNPACSSESCDTFVTHLRIASCGQLRGPHHA